MTDRSRPTVGRQIKGGFQWGCVFTVLFFLTFPFWAPLLLSVLRFVLEGLNSLGQG